MANEPKQLLVGNDNSTQTSMGESGTAEASVGTSAQTLQSQSEQTQTVKGESGVASAGVGSEAKSLSVKEESKTSTKYVEQSSDAIQNTEARELENHEEVQNVYAGSSSGEIEVEKRVLGALEKMAGVNLGQYTSEEKVTTQQKKSIVDTILVKEVKKLIKKAIREAEIGGGGGEGAKVINIDDGITEEMATYILANPGTMIEYGSYIYVPTFYGEAGGDIYYASLAADEQTLYYLVIDYEIREIVDIGEIPFGATDYGNVEIEKVWLTYDDKKSIRSCYLGANDENIQHFVNDSTRIWYNFKTSVINDKVVQEINNGKFVIRLDYPMKNRSKSEASADLLNTPQTKNGVGTRSYAKTFIGEGDKPMNENKKTVLLRSLIFITPSDIKINVIGERYIHKKISLFDYISRTCGCMDGQGFSLINNFAPLTNEAINVSGSDDDNIYQDFLQDRFSIGIPEVYQNGSEIDSPAGPGLFDGRRANKFYQSYISIYSGSYGRENQRTNSVKLNPAFSCYTVIKWVQNFGGRVSLFSPYYIGTKIQNFMEGNSSYLIQNIPDEEEGYLGKRQSRKMYMSARPRCAIVSSNYQVSNNAFIKTFKQSDQQIKLMCKAMIDVGEYNTHALPIFRTLITQK